jgi:hypothetical protein
MDIVDTGCEVPSFGNESLAVGEDVGSGRRRDYPIEVVICDNFDQVLAAIWKLHKKRKDLVTAVAAGALGMRGTHRNAADHDIVDAAMASTGNDLGQFRIHLRSALTRRRHIMLRVGWYRGSKQSESAQQN